MSQIDLHFEPNFEEYLHGVRLYDSKELMTGHTLVRFVVAGVTCGAAFAWLYGHWAYAFLGLAPMVLARISIYAARKPQCRAMYKSKLAQGRFDVSFGEDGMVSRGKSASAEIKWDGFQKVIESDRIFLLVYSKYGYVTIPKRAFESGDQMDEFRRLLDSRVQAGGAR